MIEALSEYIFAEPRRLNVFGGNLAYWDINPDRAETIVMIHGFRGNHLGLRRVIAELPGYRVIIADLPGFGLSEPMTERRHDLEGYSAVFAELIKNLGISDPHILGHSFGSLVAARLVAARPRGRGKFILINAIAVSPRELSNPVASRLVDFYYWLGYSLPEPIGERVLNNQLYARGLSRLLDTSHDPQMRRFILKHHLGDLIFKVKPRVIRESYAASMSEGVVDIVSGRGLSALIIAGALDPIAPVASQQRLESVMPDSQLDIIAGVGHLVPLEQPKRAAQLIQRYIDKT